VAPFDCDPASGSRSQGAAHLMPSRQPTDLGTCTRTGRFNRNRKGGTGPRPAAYHPRGGPAMGRVPTATTTLKVARRVPPHITLPPQWTDRSIC